MSDTRKPAHVVHLSYTVPRPAYRDPEAWLTRVAFISGVPEQMARYAKQTVIYNIEFKGEITRNGVRYLFPAFKRWQLILPFGFNRYVKQLKPDAVIVHGLIFPLQVIMLRWIMGPSLKIICQHHAEWPFKDFRRYLARRADRYIGAYLFASLVQAFFWKKEKQMSTTDKAHEIIGASSVFYPIDREIARNTTGVADGTIYLWVGDLNKNKNPLRAAEQFAEFAANHSDVSLYMIYPTGELEKELKQIVATTSAIHLVGKVEHAQMLYWFNSADYIISNSLYEGSGIAVCEALSCGCIPVLSNIPSFVTMSNYYKLGTTFAPVDKSSLRLALERSYDIDRQAESEKALRYFKAELSFEANARKIMDLINNL